MNELPPKPPRLLDKMREALRLRHYSLRTEQAYLHWTKRFMYFHGKRHPRDLGPKEVEAFLSHLADEGGVSASTQGQALAGLLFLNKQRRASYKPASTHTLRHSFATHLLESGQDIRTKATGPLGREDHDDIYPCAESRPTGHRQPVGSVARSAGAAGAALKQGEASA